MKRQRSVCILTTLAPAALAMTLTGCADQSPSPPKTAVNSGPPTSTVRIGLTEWDINLPKASARPGALTFTVTNTGSATHDLAVGQAGTRLGKTPLLAPGQRAQLRVTGVRADSRLRLICTVGGHEEAGMTAQLAVAT